MPKNYTDKLQVELGHNSQWGPCPCIGERSLGLEDHPFLLRRRGKSKVDKPKKDKSEKGPH